MIEYIALDEFETFFGPRPLETMTETELVERILDYCFECEAGPLKNCGEWKELLRRIKELEPRPAPRRPLRQADQGYIGDPGRRAHLRRTAQGRLCRAPYIGNAQPR